MNRSDWQFIDDADWRGFVLQAMRVKKLSAKKISDLTMVPLLSLRKWLYKGVESRMDIHYFTAVMHCLDIHLVVLTGHVFDVGDFKDISKFGLVRYGQAVDLDPNNKMDYAGLLRALFDFHGLKAIDLQPLEEVFGVRRNAIYRYGLKHKYRIINYKTYLKMLCYYDVPWFFYSGTIYFTGNPGQVAVNNINDYEMPIYPRHGDRKGWNVEAGSNH